jgi:hypothetical protein
MNKKHLTTIAVSCFSSSLSLLIVSCNNNITSCVGVNNLRSECNNIPENKPEYKGGDINIDRPESKSKPSPSKDSTSGQKSSSPKSLSNRHYENSDHQASLLQHNGKYEYEAQRKNSREKPIKVSCSDQEQNGTLLLNCVNGNVTYKVTVNLSQQDSIIVEVSENGKARSPLILKAVE